MHRWQMAVSLASIALVLALSSTVQAQSTPVPVPPTPTALPTMLPDQTLLVLTSYSQEVAVVGGEPIGWAILAVFFLWMGMYWLVKRVMRR